MLELEKKREMSQPLLLVVDDEAGVRQSLQLVFNKLYRVLEATSADEAIQKLADEKPDVVLLDIVMPGADGLAVLKQMRSIHTDCQVIMLTALNTARTAFTAKGTGAFDYVTKPFDVEELRLRVEHAFEKVHLFRELERLKEEVGRKYGVEHVIGRSKQIVDVFKAVSMVAAKKSTVLITGESGTGKDLVARAIHAGSPRRDNMFLPYNCTSATRELADSQLFGHRRGSFTGAIADQAGVLRTAVGGTLFLDEVGDLPLDVQPKLLRFLEQGEVLPVGDTRPQRVDVRVVAATNADLENRVSDGKFREDLFYRLSVIRIHVPPLRDRREEIPHLSTFFLREACERLGKPGVRLTAETLDIFDTFPWPGNVRQLRNEVQRAVAMASPDGSVTPDRLSPVFGTSELPSDAGTRSRHRRTTLAAAVEKIEREMIQSALERSAGNISETARTLGLTRRGLYLKMDRLGVQA